MSNVYGAHIVLGIDVMETLVFKREQQTKPQWDPNTGLPATPKTVEKTLVFLYNVELSELYDKAGYVFSVDWKDNRASIKGLSSLGDVLSDTYDWCQLRSFASGKVLGVAMATVDLCSIREHTPLYKKTDLHPVNSVNTLASQQFAKLGKDNPCLLNHFLCADADQ